MKNTEAHPESASGRLAAYFESHKDAMTNEWVAREAFVLFLPGPSNSLANRGRIFFRAFARNVAVFHCRHFDMKINPIEERSRDPLAIALDLHRTAAAFAFEVAKISARAGIQTRAHVSIKSKAREADLMYCAH
jgi:hypothetical protein